MIKIDENTLENQVSWLQKYEDLVKRQEDDTEDQKLVRRFFDFGVDPAANRRSLSQNLIDNEHERMAKVIEMGASQESYTETWHHVEQTSVLDLSRRSKTQRENTPDVNRTKTINNFDYGFARRHLRNNSSIFQSDHNLHLNHRNRFQYDLQKIKRERKNRFHKKSKSFSKLLKSKPSGKENIIKIMNEDDEHSDQNIKKKSIIDYETVEYLLGSQNATQFRDLKRIIESLNKGDRRDVTDIRYLRRKSCEGRNSGGRIRKTLPAAKATNLRELLYNFIAREIVCYKKNKCMETLFIAHHILGYDIFSKSKGFKFEVFFDRNTNFEQLEKETFDQTKKYNFERYEKFKKKNNIFLEKMIAEKMDYDFIDANIPKFIKRKFNLTKEELMDSSRLNLNETVESQNDHLSKPSRRSKRSKRRKPSKMAKKFKQVGIVAKFLGRMNTMHTPTVMLGDKLGVGLNSSMRKRRASIQFKSSRKIEEVNAFNILPLKQHESHGLISQKQNSLRIDKSSKRINRSGLKRRKRNKQFTTLVFKQLADKIGDSLEIKIKVKGGSSKEKSKTTSFKKPRTKLNSFKKFTKIKSNIKLVKQESEREEKSKEPRGTGMRSKKKNRFATNLVFESEDHPIVRGFQRRATIQQTYISSRSNGFRTSMTIGRIKDSQRSLENSKHSVITNSNASPLKPLQNVIESEQFAFKDSSKTIKSNFYNAPRRSQGVNIMITDGHAELSAPEPKKFFAKKKKKKRPKIAKKLPKPLIKHKVMTSYAMRAFYPRNSEKKMKILKTEGSLPYMKTLKIDKIIKSSVPKQPRNFMLSARKTKTASKKRIMRRTANTWRTTKAGSFGRRYESGYSVPKTKRLSTPHGNKVEQGKARMLKTARSDKSFRITFPKRGGSFQQLHDVYTRKEVK